MGAKRIELNAAGSYDAGGTTPKVDEVRLASSELKVPLRVMIRPRGPPKQGPDFIYTEAEYELMQTAILRFKDAHIMNPGRGDGFVFGILKEQLPEDAKYPDERLAVDVPRCSELIELAKPYGCVFHRAFDEIAATGRWNKGLNDLIMVGFEGVLTSGGKGSYIDNVKHLQSMFRVVATKPLELIVGGGVRAANVDEPAKQFVQLRDCSLWMHTACIMKTVRYPDGKLDTDQLNVLLKAIEQAIPD